MHINYTSFNESIFGMTSKNDKIYDIEDHKFHIIHRNKNKVILLPKLNENLTIRLKDLYDKRDVLNKYEFICLQYIPEDVLNNKEFKNELRENKVRIYNRFSLDSLISRFDNEYFDYCGKRFIDIRETKNNIEKNNKVIIKDSFNNIEEIELLIKRWNDTSGMKYRRTNHSGYDLNFFRKYYKPQNYFGLFFYDPQNFLIGYSIANNTPKYINNIPCYSYIIRKCLIDQGIRNLTLYIDTKTFENVHKGVGDEFFVHWGASGGTLLGYKEKFPVYDKKKIKFFMLKGSELYK